MKSGSHYEKPSTGSSELESRMNSLVSDRAKQDALLFPTYVAEPEPEPEPERTYRSQMEPDDLQFVQMQGYSVDRQQPLTEWIERAVRFMENGDPDWDHMQRVADTILFSLDIVQFKPTRGVEIDYWVPYKFRLGPYGNCIVRIVRPVEQRKGR